MAYDIAPDTIVHRYRIRGALWGAALGLGITLHLLSFSVVVFGAWSVLVAPIAAGSTLGVLWGQFGPVKVLKGRIPAARRSTPSARDDSPDARRAAQLAAARQVQAELQSFAKANADDAMCAALLEAETDILNRGSRRAVRASGDHVAATEPTTLVASAASDAATPDSATPDSATPDSATPVMAQSSQATTAGASIAETTHPRITDSSSTSIVETPTAATGPDPTMCTLSDLTPLASIETGENGFFSAQLTGEQDASTEHPTPDQAAGSSNVSVAETQAQTNSGSIGQDVLAGQLQEWFEGFGDDLAADTSAFTAQLDAALVAAASTVGSAVPV